MKLRILIFAGLIIFSSGVCGQDCVLAPDGLVAWWPGDGTAEDVQSGHDGVMINGATFTSGIVGQAFSFDGIDDYVEVPFSSDFNIQDEITMMAWVKKQGACYHNYNCPVLAKLNAVGGTDVSNIRYGMLVYGWGNQEAVLGLNTTYWRDVVKSTTPINDDGWYHIAAVWDGQVAKMFVNGEFESSYDVGGPIKPSTAGPLFIGAALHYKNELFNGLVDEVQLFNRALNAAEIREGYVAGEAGMCKVAVIECHGFEPPMADHPVKAKKNRAFPLKVQLFDAEGFEVTDAEVSAAPLVEVMFTAAGTDDAVDVTDDLLSVGLGTDGNQFIYIADDNMWKFNLKATNYTAPGIYAVTALSGAPDEYVLDPSCVTSFEVN